MGDLYLGIRLVQYRALFFFFPLSGNIVTVNIKLNVVEVYHSNDLPRRINVKRQKSSSERSYY